MTLCDHILTHPRHQNKLVDQGSSDLLKFKAFADDNLNDTQMMEFVFEWIENNMGKGENAGYQHFLPIP